MLEEEFIKFLTEHGYKYQFQMGYIYAPDDEPLIEEHRKAIARWKIEKHAPKHEVKVRAIYFAQTYAESDATKRLKTLMTIHNFGVPFDRMLTE